MPEPKEVALGLVTSIGDFMGMDRLKKAEVAAEAVDLLLGPDPTALISSVPGLTPALFELLTDALKEQVKQKFLGGD